MPKAARHEPPFRMMADRSKPRACSRRKTASVRCPMEWFEGRPSMPRGGGSASGSFYHLSFRSGSRAGGACAGVAHAYITRTEEYDDPERDAALYTESDHMPSWARDDPHEYWDAADLFERANG